MTVHARIAGIFVTVLDHEVFNEVLKIVLDVLHSPFGVFGFVAEDGALEVPTMTRQVWDQCQMPAKAIRFPRETWGESRWPRAILGKRTIHSNEPFRPHPRGSCRHTKAHLRAPADAGRGHLRAGLEVLPKPFTTAALAQRVRAALDAPPECRNRERP